MTNVVEGTHKLDDGFEVYTKTWNAASPKACVLFVHGFSDHCNNYDELFPHLANQGITVYSFDQRGWGRSAKKPSQRGLTGPTSQVLSDISSMLRPLTNDPSTPLFLAGHSMGGAEVLSYLSLDPSNLCTHLRGVIAIAPLIALHPTTRPWKGTVIAGRLVGRLLPKRQMVNKLDPQLLSHDVELNKQWAEDELNHDTGTLEGLAGMLERGEMLENGTWRVAEGKNEGGKTRLLVCHGTEDRINDFEGSRDYVERFVTCADKELRSYEGWYHNLHVETIGKTKEGFRQDIAGWILERLDLFKGTPGQTEASQAKL